MKKILLTFLVVLCFFNTVIVNAQWQITYTNVDANNTELPNPVCGVDTRFKVTIQVPENLIAGATTFKFDVYDPKGTLIKNWGPKKIGTITNGVLIYNNQANGVSTNTFPTINGKPPYIIGKYTFNDTNGGIIATYEKRIYICDSDYDLDGISNAIDNCMYTINSDQADKDGDGIGNLCDDDLDGDGINNNIDNCSNTYNPNQSDTDGDGIGDICDIVFDKPDLTISKTGVLIISQCFDCFAQLDELKGRHILFREAGIFNIQQMIIDNIGTAPANPSNVKIYLSSDASLDATDYYFSTYDITLPKIAAKNYYISQKTVFGVDVPTSKAYGDYYILLVLDKNNLINESNETNNLIAIPITFKQNNFSKSSSTAKNIEIEDSILSYRIEVFDLSGNKIGDKKVSSIDEENAFVSQLPKNIYIIKNEKGNVRKVLY